jgi:hypothetical protein
LALDFNLVNPEFRLFRRPITLLKRVANSSGDTEVEIMDIEAYHFHQAAKRETSEVCVCVRAGV